MVSRKPIEAFDYYDFDDKACENHEILSENIFCFVCKSKSK